MVARQHDIPHSNIPLRLAAIDTIEDYGYDEDVDIEYPVNVI